MLSIGIDTFKIIKKKNTKKKHILPIAQDLQHLHMDKKLLLVIWSVVILQYVCITKQTYHIHGSFHSH